ncbi:MAG: MFS transporter [bacterium]
MLNAFVQRMSQRQFAALKVRNFRLYFGGSVISVAGTWMQTTGQAWLVLKITDSPLALATVASLQFLPITLFTLFGGAFADRFPRRPVMFITQSLAMAQSLLLGILAATGTVEIWHIYILAASLGMINALDGPLRQSFVSELVDREHLPNAIALNSLVQNLGRILGPAAGGAVIGFFGVETAFFLNAASFVGILAALAILDRSQLKPRVVKANAGSVFRQVGEGLGFARKTPRILFLLILASFIGMFGYNFTTIIPLVATYLLDASPNQFGLLNSCLGAGSFLAAMVLAARGRPSNARVLGASLAFGIVLVLIGTSKSFLLSGFLFVCVGAASVTFSTGVSTSLQLLAPDYMRGRMASMHQLLIAGSSPVGGELTGAMVHTVSVSGALFLNGAMCCAGVATALVYRWRAGVTEHPGDDIEVRPVVLREPALSEQPGAATGQ